MLRFAPAVAGTYLPQVNKTVWPSMQKYYPCAPALAACCGFDLCHKYILYLYLLQLSFES
jgi:hypothetical protein